MKDQSLKAFFKENRTALFLQHVQEKWMYLKYIDRKIDEQNNANHISMISRILSANAELDVLKKLNPNFLLFEIDLFESNLTFELPKTHYFDVENANNKLRRKIRPKYAKLYYQLVRNLEQSKVKDILNLLNQTEEEIYQYAKLHGLNFLDCPNVHDRLSFTVKSALMWKLSNAGDFEVEFLEEIENIMNFYKTVETKQAQAIEMFERDKDKDI